MTETTSPVSTVKPFDSVSFMMDFESGDLDDASIVEGFQKLIDSGLVWSLQGSYGRTANSLIEQGLCTRPTAAQTAANNPSKVGPFEGVSHDIVRDFDGDKYRVVVYAAYNASGLIGYESNGVAVLSESERNVVCDEMAKASSGYHGPSSAQIALFNKLSACSEQEFRDTVNSHTNRLRYEI